MSKNSVNDEILEEKVFQRNFTTMQARVTYWLRVHAVDLIMVVLLFFLSFWFKLWFYHWFDETFGDFFYFSQTTGPAEKLRYYMLADPEKKLEWQGFGDASHYYVPYVSAFSRGWNPYSGGYYPDDPLNGYVYGPLYVFFISMFTMFFGLDAWDSILYSNLLFDAASIVLVYLIARKTSDYFVSTMAAIVTTLSPVVLVYNDFKLLNMPQVTFFALLAVYFLLNGNDDLAIFSIAIGFLTKQIPLLMFGTAMVYIFRKHGILRSITFAILFFIYILVFSYPWVAYTPKAVFQKIFLPSGGKRSLGIPAINVAITLPESMYYKGWVGPAQFLFPIVNEHYLFAASMLLSAALVFFGYKYLKDDPRLHVRFYNFFLLIGHVTLARGIYKYYDSIFIPFIVLALFMQEPINQRAVNHPKLVKVCHECGHVNPGIENTCQECKEDLSKVPLRYPPKPALKDPLIDKQWWKPQYQHVLEMLHQKQEAIIDYFYLLMYLLVATLIVYLINIQILNIEREEHPVFLAIVTITFALWMGKKIWFSLATEPKIVYQEYKTIILNMLEEYNIKLSFLKKGKNHTITQKQPVKEAKDKDIQAKKAQNNEEK